MDKNAIKKFAINSRENLLDMVRQRAGLFGITKDGISDKLEISTNEIEYYVDDKVPLVGKDIPKRCKLVEELKTRAKKSDYQTAFTDLTEEVAYTWFNRIVAIRFMEVNDYLPSRTRVLSSTQNRNEPDIMIDPLSLEADLGAFSDDDRQLINDAWETEDPLKMDDLYKMLFIKQVNALNKNLPYLFEKTNDYAELLFTPNYNQGVIKSIVTDIDEADFDVSQGGQVEIIGWIYQYYNTDNKEKAISSPKSHKFRDTEIASVTQIFTPDWIVKYMVQNSLGKLWIKSLIEKDDSRTEEEIASTFNWKYYMSEAKQPDNVIIALKNIDEPLKDIKPTDIQMIDPSMGSGHILVYAFDVLMQIYKSEGYSEREASKLIVSNNLHGLDIDTRAFQLSYFAVYMKLRQYNRRALSSNIKLNIYDVPETNETNIDDFEPLFEKLSNDSIDSIRSLVNLFKNGNDLGSLIQTQNIDYLSLTNDLNKVNIDQLSFEIIPLLHQVEMLINVSKLLGSYYHVVITNPPYMGSSRMDLSLSDFSKKYYPNSKSDLFSMFIERWNKSILPGGYNCMVTMQSWMFLSSFEKMRTHLLENYTISNLMHMENNVMGIAFGTAVAVIRNTKIPKFIGTYHQIKTADASNKIPTSVPIPGNRFNRTNQANFSKIPGSPIAYWTSSNVFSIFQKSKKISDYGYSKKGLDTGKNALYYRFWHEVSNNVGYWIPLNKGGNFRKWYGNQIYIINWLNDGYRIKNNGKANIRNEKFYFKPNLSWTDLTSGSFSARYTPRGFIFDASGPSYFGNNLNEMLAYLNSTVFNYLAKLTMSTMHYTNGQVAKMPFKDFDNGDINSIVTVNISISKKDWDSFETSWDFQQHPFLNHIADDKRTEVDGKVENAFNIWKSEAQDRFNQLKSNEEELNKIFIDLYGLQDELTPEVADKDVSVRLADKERDIKSFLSYFIGVVFGRYSLDTDGLAFAGGEWDASKYKMFVPNDDNLLMLNDAKYFDDERDIINRLKEFLTVTFGKETLTDNLQYIASVVGKKADNDEDSIRRYFVEDFFKDHKKIYQKRPIYWEFSSGKANGFKALMYLHRYDENELAMVRTNYLHTLQGKYETSLNQINQFIDVETVTKTKKKLEKELTHVTKQLSEIKKYDAVIQHLANERIALDLDDGVVVNYEKLQNGEKILSKYN